MLNLVKKSLLPLRKMKHLLRLYQGHHQKKDRPVKKKLILKLLLRKNHSIDLQKKNLAHHQLKLIDLSLQLLIGNAGPDLVLIQNLAMIVLRLVIPPLLKRNQSLLNLKVKDHDPSLRTNKDLKKN